MYVYVHWCVHILHTKRWALSNSVLWLSQTCFVYVKIGGIIYISAEKAAFIYCHSWGIRLHIHVSVDHTCLFSALVSFSIFVVFSTPILLTYRLALLYVQLGGAETFCFGHYSRDFIAVHWVDLMEIFTVFAILEWMMWSALTAIQCQLSASHMCPSFGPISAWYSFDLLQFPAP